MSKTRKSAMFPEEQHILRQLGENIRLAMKRRKLTLTMLAGIRKNPHEPSN
jgi:hypothetical protein